MAKRIETKLIEERLLYERKNVGELVIDECTFGRHGIVDVVSCSTKFKSHGKGKPRTREYTWRFFEIKVSKADFNSKAKITFIGDFNYYVMPEELYEEVKHKIPEHVGVYIATFSGLDGENPRAYLTLKKKPKRQKPKMAQTELMHQMAISLFREAYRSKRQERGVKAFSASELANELVQRRAYELTRYEQERLTKYLNRQKTGLVYKDTIFLDMDGTIADTYRVPNWLDYINNNDASLFTKAKSVSEDNLKQLLRSFGDKEIIILTMYPETDLTGKEKEDYYEEVRKAKREWVNKNLPILKTSVIRYVEYGVSKSTYCNSPRDVLIDDSSAQLQAWKGIAVKAPWCLTLEKALKLV